MQGTFAERATSSSRSSRGIMRLTKVTSRPSRCMAPPSAQKSFWTSTRISALCRGSTFWLNVLSIAFLHSRFPQHDVEVERLRELLAHGDVEIGLQARDIELGRKFRK